MNINDIGELSAAADAMSAWSERQDNPVPDLTLNKEEVAALLEGSATSEPVGPKRKRKQKNVKAPEDQGVLSQDEIDSLLTAIASGDVDSEADAPRERRHKTYRIYDFRRPDNWSREQVTALSWLHESFALAASTFLAEKFSTTVDIHVASVDQLTRDEYARSLNNPTFIADAHLGGVCACTLEIDPYVFYGLQGIMPVAAGTNGWEKGQRHDGTKCPKSDREITLDAQDDSLARDLLTALQHTWKQAHPTLAGDQVLSLRTRSHLGADVSGNAVAEMCVLVTLEAMITNSQGDKVESMITLNYPQRFFNPELLRELNPAEAHGVLRHRRSVKTGDTFVDTQASKRLGTLGDVEVPVEVRMGRTGKRFADLMQVQEGTILMLDSYVNETLDIIVGGRVFARGEVVVLADQFGIRVTEVLP